MSGRRWGRLIEETKVQEEIIEKGIEASIMRVEAIEGEDSIEDMITEGEDTEEITTVEDLEEEHNMQGMGIEGKQKEIIPQRMGTK